ncbi:hypothetical protein B0O99DRAFT_307015 [Bisporella sp. PMI_857]|nr:hypothetical protein B0O99DRAFT_307015 [Bisporella sp. PMI_857]
MLLAPTGPSGRIRLDSNDSPCLISTQSLTIPNRPYDVGHWLGISTLLWIAFFLFDSSTFYMARAAFVSARTSLWPRQHSWALCAKYQLSNGMSMCYHSVSHPVSKQHRSTTRYGTQLPPGCYIPLSILPATLKSRRSATWSYKLVPLDILKIVIRVQSRPVIYHTFAQFLFFPCYSFSLPVYVSIVWKRGRPGRGGGEGVA